jgi:hypothetical protein
MPPPLDPGEQDFGSQNRVGNAVSAVGHREEHPWPPLCVRAKERQPGSPTIPARSVRCVSISYWSNAVLAAVLPQATSRCSSTMTSIPWAASSRAISAPLMPPPTTATSQDAFSSSGGKACMSPFFTAQ